MAALDGELRKLTDKLILGARNDAEDAARAALANLAVKDREPHRGLNAEQRDLRNALRARARQFGEGSWHRGYELLVEEVAYEQWHRMLFARFLGENGLLMLPDFANVAVTIEQCAALADETGKGNAWDVAATFASKMLPGIFRQDDPSAQVQLAPEGRAKLERTLAELPGPLFTADDGLGWVYQFWQTKRKQEVSSGGKKIERLDLATYSQLFTEDYMVRFLLENSLGAWWATRHPQSALVRQFEYLRFRNDGLPAAGTFAGWPAKAAEVTVMDPCCGSGHFLVAAFEMLRRMRAEEEGLSEGEAADAVLRDNLFGLELDDRCVQIAAFALALAAWKAGRYRQLPALNLACSGIPVGGQLEEWTKLASNDVNLSNSLEQLYRLFRNAPDLGSLIDPRDVPRRDHMFAPDFSQVEPMLGRALARGSEGDPVAAVFGESARGIARASQLLAHTYTLVATNVPFLTVRKQGDLLKQFLAEAYPEGRHDLAAAFILRCRDFTIPNGGYAMVTPQYWLFLSSFESLREKQLREQTARLVARLGAGAFDTITGEFVNVCLGIWENCVSTPDESFAGIDASGGRSPSSKAQSLRTADISNLHQAEQLKNPGARIELVPTATSSSQPLLSSFASALSGAKSGDIERFSRCFWEVPAEFIGEEWELYQGAPGRRDPFCGREHVIFWQKEAGEMMRLAHSVRHLNNVAQNWRRGKPNWGKSGVVVGLMGDLQVSLYTGEIYDSNCCAIVPHDAGDVPALWAYCWSGEYGQNLHALHPAVAVGSSSTLLNVPFDREHWRSVAKTQFPDGLPHAYSNDPTQWVFLGNPADTQEPLQVAVALLLSYRWPEQDGHLLTHLEDPSGIICIPQVRGNPSAVDRLRTMLSAAFDCDWSPALESKLLENSGFAGKGLEAYLRDGFFDRHCKLFHQRPLIWQIWDGRKDGFSALVNHHRLDKSNLDRLTYTYLGQWIEQQRASSDPQAETRLIAAQKLQDKLKLIAEGEPPYDIYVRWKPLHEQSIGWEPDLNDGVRLNIRPFVQADILRVRPNIKWGRDRGTNPDGSERINDLHHSNAEKRGAREAAAGRAGKVVGVR